jgi:hypothetical protein
MGLAILASTDRRERRDLEERFGVALFGLTLLDDEREDR